MEPFSMSTAWFKLREGSDAPLGSTAWECLNNLNSSQPTPLPPQEVLEAILVKDVITVGVEDLTVSVTAESLPKVDVLLDIKTVKVSLEDTDKGSDNESYITR